MDKKTYTQLTLALVTSLGEADQSLPTPLSHVWLGLQSHLPTLTDFQLFTSSLEQAGYVTTTTETIKLTAKGLKIADLIQEARKEANQ